MKHILVYKDIEWREVGEKPINEEVWSRNKACPREGEKRWIRNNHFYIDAAIGERVWLLYQPAASFFNGWAEHPEELDASALVEVEVTKLQSPIWAVQEDEKFFLENPDWARWREKMESSGQAQFGRYSPNERKGWAKVSCQRVVPFVQIAEEFSTASRPEYEEVSLVSSEQYQTSMLTLHTIRHQEAHEWWITTNDSPRRLLLFCLDICGDPIEVCNWLLPD